MNNIAQKSLPTYNEAFKQFGSQWIDTVRELDRLEREGYVTRQHADEVLSNLIESQVHALTQVVVRARMADYKNKHR